MNEIFNMEIIYFWSSIIIILGILFRISLWFISINIKNKKLTKLIKLKELELKELENEKRI